LSLSCLLWACPSQPGSPPDEPDSPPADTTVVDPPNEAAYLIIPGEGFGEIKPGMTTTELKAILGEEKVKDQEFYLGEGYFEPGLILYPDSPLELAIHLQNDSVHLVRLTKDSSVWQTVEGITIGSSLQDVVAANGSKFDLMGFEWDYGGTVTDWKGGQFADKDFLLRFALSYGNESLPHAEVQAIMGDQVISSDHPVLLKYDVKVIEITQR